MTNKKQRLRGGTFNLKHSRKRTEVHDEVAGLLAKHNLDFLCVQEAKDYVRALDRIEGYIYFVDRTGTRGGTESGILVREGLTTKGFKVKWYGNGWKRHGGGTHAATVQPQVKIDDWLFVRSLHLPTPSHWDKGKLSKRTPDGRKDDLIAAMRGLRYFFRWPSKVNARCAAGDWNEPPTTDGEFSPAWLAKNTGSKAYVAKQRQGHGRIDWAMVKGATVTRVFKDLRIKEGSDHEPVIFIVER